MVVEGDSVLSKEKLTIKGHARSCMIATLYLPSILLSQKSVCMHIYIYIYICVYIYIIK